MNKILAINRIREKLKNNGISIGSWMQIPNASVAEIMGNAGYDWVAIDLEHGSISTQKLPDLFRALELGNTLPLARVAQGEQKDCKLALDAGAGGIIVPMVETANQLQEVANYCRWPPAGKRGVGFSRANLFGKNFESYSKEAQSPILVAQIEHINAVHNLAEICEVKGLDALLIGPYDLSASMGMTAMFENQEYLDVLSEISSISHKHKIPVGMHVVKPSKEELAQKINDGYRFIAYSIDSVFFVESCELPK